MLHRRVNNDNSIDFMCYIFFSLVTLHPGLIKVHTFFLENKTISKNTISKFGDFKTFLQGVYNSCSGQDPVIIIVP